MACIDKQPAPFIIGMSVLTAVLVVSNTVRECVQNVLMGGAAPAIGILMTAVLPAVGAVIYLLSSSEPNLFGLLASVCLVGLVASTCAALIWVYLGETKDESEISEEFSAGRWKLRFSSQSTQLRLPLIINNGIMPQAPYGVLLVIFSSEVAAAYAVARAAANAIATPTATLFSLFAAKAAKIYSEGGARRARSLEEVFVGFWALTNALVLPLAGLEWIYAGDLVFYLSDQRDETATYFLTILLCGVVINSLTGPSGYGLIMVGQERNYKVSTLSGLLVLITALVLAPSLGSEALVALSTLAVAFVNVLSLLYFIKAIRSLRE